MPTREECNQGIHTVDNQGLCHWCGTLLEPEWYDHYLHGPPSKSHATATKPNLEQSMNPYCVFTTTYEVTKDAANRINKAIKAIDDTAAFVGPVSIPGNNTKGWIERPNDGTNDYNHVRERNSRMAAIARKELGMED